jgi:hypothetical protein
MTLRPWFPRLLLAAVLVLIVIGTTACGGGKY